MRNAIESLLHVIDCKAGEVAIVWCPDSGLRDWLVEQVESLVPDTVDTLRVTDVGAALREPDRLVLLIPQNEHQAVLDLDAGLGSNPKRCQPVLLFLLREGDGARTLAHEAQSLRSWVNGNEIDPEALAEIDVAKEREAFETAHAETPEIWLARLRSGVLPMSGENTRIAFDASLLKL